MKRNHRTAVFVRTDSDAAEYRERVDRLVSSLNGENINADIFSVSNGNVTKGLVWPTASSVNDGDLVGQATEAGYVQAIVVNPTG